MEPGDLDRTSIVAGIVFIVLGMLFLLERAGVLDVQPAYVWPLLLIGLGVAVLLGGRRERHRWAPDDIVESRVVEAPSTTSSQDATAEERPDRHET